MLLTYLLFPRRPSVRLMCIARSLPLGDGRRRPVLPAGCPDKHRVCSYPSPLLPYSRVTRKIRPAPRSAFLLLCPLPDHTRQPPRMRDEVLAARRTKNICQVDNSLYAGWPFSQALAPATQPLSRIYLIVIRLCVKTVPRGGTRTLSIVALLEHGVDSLTPLEPPSSSQAR